ncbi:MAG: alpha/beta hydrolase [Tetrasphaera sp.]
MTTTPSGIAYDHVLPHQVADSSLPLVLLHAGVADHRVWGLVWPSLVRHQDVLRMDLRGFGDSTSAPPVAGSDVADVLEVLDESGIGRCHLVDASYGAGVAVEVALTTPARVASLVLCPPGGALLSMTPDLRAFIDAEAATLAAGAIEAAVEANVTTWLVGQGRSAAVLVIVGEHDLDSYRDAGSPIVTEVSNARMELWQNAAHLLHHGAARPLRAVPVALVRPGYLTRPYGRASAWAESHSCQWIWACAARSAAAAP